MELTTSTIRVLRRKDVREAIEKDGLDAFISFWWVVTQTGNGLDRLEEMCLFSGVAFQQPFPMIMEGLVRWAYSN